MNRSVSALERTMKFGVRSENAGTSADHLRTKPPLMELPAHSIGRAIQCLRDGKSYVYFIGGDVGAIKIGLSICPLERLASMQMGSPVRLRILALAVGERALEKEYHARFAEHRSHGEWFERSPEILTEIERLRAR